MVPSARSRPLGASLTLLITVSVVLGVTPALASAAPTAQAGLSIEPADRTFAEGEPVVLTVTNEGSTPEHGDATITIHRCPLGPDLCTARQEPIAQWSEGSMQLAPGENQTVTWDRTTEDGSRAEEGTYEAHLTFNRTTGGQETATSREFSLANGTGGATDPDAPRIEVRSPATGASTTTLRVSVDVHIEATDRLDRVSVRVDGAPVVTAESISAREHNATSTVDLDAGTHVLTVSARDEAGRTNRTHVPFTVAPDRMLTAGPMVFNATRNGGLDEVRWDQEMLFKRVETASPETGFRTAAKNHAVVLEAPPGTPIEHELDESWSVTRQGQGLLLEHRTAGARVVLSTAGGPAPTVDGNRLTAETGPTGELVLRPVLGTTGETAITDAILEGQLGAEVDLTTPATPEVLRYSATNVTLATTEHRVAAILDHADGDGRAFVFDLGPGMSTGELSISIDGEPVQEASSLEDALDATDDGAASEAYVVETEDGDRRVVVSVASFSAHEVVIEATEGLGAFLTPVSIVGALAVTTVAGWALFRRPSR